jgi:hypothetical protein
MALKLLACTLLLEITAFLRETFKTLPRTRAPIKVNLGVVRLNNMIFQTSLHPASAAHTSSRQDEQRRWSILSNTFTPAQQRGGSIASVSEMIEFKSRESKVEINAGYSFIKNITNSRRTRRSSNELRVHSRQFPTWQSFKSECRRAERTANHH